MASEPRTCTVTYPDGERCDRLDNGAGLCSGHRYRRQQHGDPLIGGKLRILRRKGTVWCNVGRVAPWVDEPKCPAPYLAQGFCGKHYTRFTKHGDPLCLAYNHSLDEVCSVPGCERPRSSSGGFCRRHYRRAKANGGDPLGGSRNSDLLERLQRRVVEGPLPLRFYNHATDAYDADPPCPCRDWMGATAQRRGHITYGIMSVEDVRRAVHRVTYELANGPIPKGLHLDHLCCRPTCCEPRHLEPVTMRENLRRSALVERIISDRYRDEFFGGTLYLRGPEAVAARTA